MCSTLVPNKRQRINLVKEYNNFGEIRNAVLTYSTDIKKHNALKTVRRLEMQRGVVGQ
jgi:hypothetical protein